MTVVTHGKAGDLHVPDYRVPSSPLVLLPQTDWWKLFIARKYHKEAAPYLLFDREKSKGFHAVMMRVFRTHLGPDSSLGTRLDFDFYERLYHEVSDEVGGIAHRGRSGTNAPVGSTHFPMEYTPTPLALTELFAEGVGIYNLQTGERREPLHEIAVYYPTGMMAGRLSVAYRMEDVPALANAIFDRFYLELVLAGGNPLNELRAIVKAVRSLHVHHFFRDANGRLNTMVVLNKWLMESGFPPAILSDPAIFGGAFSINDLVKKVVKAMHRILRLMQAEQLFRKFGE